MEPFTEFRRAGKRLLALAAERPRSLALILVAVLSASGAVTAAAALAGDSPVSADTPQDSTPTASATPTDGGTASPTGTSTEATKSHGHATPGGDEGAKDADDANDEGDSNDDGGSPTGTPGTPGTPGTTPSATLTGSDPHSNGHGCDDIIHGGDATPGPGGPVGCTVGDSGDHRQNGAK